MKNAKLHDAASTLAHRKGSWLPFTPPAASAAGRTLAKARNSHRPARASSRKTASRTGTRSKAASARKTRSSR